VAIDFIEICGVSKTYNTGVLALDEVNVSVRKGQVIALIGPSGSGKSTLLRCINNLEPIDKGRIHVDGEHIGDEWRDGHLVRLPDYKAAKQRAEIGMVFQSFNLFPDMTALQNVMVAPIHVRRISKEQAKIDAMKLLERVHLAEKACTYPVHLSGGQQQRVAIARALAMKPKAMLFDEPTSALDPETINEVLEVIREVAEKDGMTMMIATHEMAFAKEVANRVIFMKGGKIVEEAPAARFFAEPASPEAQMFLAAGSRRNTGLAASDSDAASTRRTSYG
jgi:polar amino acid transport system ATP-binding protein